MDVVLLFPGQGSQKPGMGKDLAAAFPEARRVFDEVDDALAFKLSELCFEGPADDLTATLNAQPALLAHGAAVWSVVKSALGERVRAAAGHSLGEHTAYHAAGSTTLADAARLVRKRGQLMYETGVTRPGAMAAVLGKLDDSIESLCELATRSAGLVVPANYNTAEQIVVSGEVSGVERLMALAKENGAKRAVRLPVSGAFHSPLMEPAVAGFEEAVNQTEFAEPAFPVYSNVTEEPSTSSANARELLVRQLTAPVRWTGEVTNIAAKFQNALFVELGPGNVLTGLLTRIVPAARGIACGTPADVDKLITQLAS
ncbi:MAG TPA: ACP S-malonyltransferase [Gemmatimonadaceae bacterium]|nr:ACP S-malonyltransferase [Gemmatimonadaceae bacterium]